MARKRLLACVAICKRAQSSGKCAVAGKSRINSLNSGDAVSSVSFGKISMLKMANALTLATGTHPPNHKPS
eukprot:4433265-Amphidinium_carterae.2